MGLINGVSDQKVQPNGTSGASTRSSGSRYVQEPIAVVGMGCRLPGNCNSPHALWEFLNRGGIAETTPPDSRFRRDTHHDGTKRPKTMRSPGGMFLESVDPKKFDAPFFGIGKVDAIAMDPQQRQLLEVVYECLENAGIPLEKLDGQAVGCFIGSYAVDYADMQSRDPEDRVPSVTIGVGRAILSNRISHFLNVHGPSMTIDTACSGSLVGLDVACRYLSSGEIDGAIVAGANLYLSPEHVMDSGSMKGASSPSGRCHTFDKKADGYIKAEGINCVMLKRLSDAERQGDAIRAIIRGTATNSDGRTPGIASPSSEAQAKAIRAAYANAGISDLSKTGYIEMHGTGTQAGDPQEVKGVGSVFASSRQQDQRLMIGSIKSNIGHSEPAAGVSGLIKAILAVENGLIPGSPTFIDPNPSIDFEGSRVQASRYTMPWPNEIAPRRASVNSFGYGGSNAHAIVDQAPTGQGAHKSSYRNELDNFLDDDDDESVMTRPHILLFSANDASSLRASTEALQKHLLDPRVAVELDSLAYTLSERRTRHFHRGYVVANSIKLEPTEIVYGKKTSETPRVGFIFTGQGAQWSQMGRSLLENFAEAREIVNHLDSVLQNTIHPPKWTLIQELTEPRNPETLRRPEFSQPLVTALQIALVTVLRKWGLRPGAVVGHSSGEIAAAYAAGLLSAEDAIKAAYYRGYASTLTRLTNQDKFGMMAVGLGASNVQAYLDKTCSNTKGLKAVTVACYNSPDSVTLSGPYEALEKVRTEIVADGHFARMLQVDMAYHSSYMAATGDEYFRNLTDERFEAVGSPISGVKMFSSVEGGLLESPTDIMYWKSNMVQPVMFEQALKAMLQDKDAPNFLIEIGPSGALAGPTGQVKKALPGGGADIQYCTAMVRGKTAENAVFDVAGRLFVAGYDLDYCTVNNLQGEQKLLVDLPNYSWNHAAEYWYENEASRDWRYRRFPRHDILGTKVLGTAWEAPSWKNSLKVEHLPWLRDHRLGPDIVFPGAGYMCMAIEAMMQVDAVLNSEASENGNGGKQVRLRNVSFDRALVLDEDTETRTMLTLAPRGGGSWYHWVVRSLVDDSWIEHCRGQVRMDKDIDTVADCTELKPLQHATAGNLWYKSMSDVGYNFGKSFQKLQAAETVSGQRTCRSHVDLQPAPSENVQSHYPIHPAALDGCMQSCAPGLWRGVTSNVRAVLVPAVIDDIVICLGREEAKTGISISESYFAGPGRKEATDSYASNAKVYDCETGKLVFNMTGLGYSKLDVSDSPYALHSYSKLVWEPDITMSPQACASYPLLGRDMVQNILDLLAHKSPNMSVVEASLIPSDSSSVWLDRVSSESTQRNAFGSYEFLTNDAAAVISTQEKYGNIPRTDFRLLQLNQLTQFNEKEPLLANAQLVILRLPASIGPQLATIMTNISQMMHPDGRILMLQQYAEWIAMPVNGTTVVDTASNGSGHFDKDSMKMLGLDLVHDIDCSQDLSMSHAYLFNKTPHVDSSPDIQVDIVHLTEPGPAAEGVRKSLQQRDWSVQELALDALAKVRGDAAVLVISELDTPQLPTLSPEQWNGVQTLLQIRNHILWVSRSSQFKGVSNPDGAMIHGLCRSVRTEDPSMRLTTLDIESPAGDGAATVIDQLLRAFLNPSAAKGFEGEYVERQGVLHVSRMLGNDAINAAEKARVAGSAPVEARLHECDVTTRLIAERTGSIESLQYVQIASQEAKLPDNKVEVELFASALNFKDVAVTMGIVPEDSHLLGLEGAGTIRRVGANLNSNFVIGQRVLVFEKGTFANRIVATTERTIAIPDSMTFEEAATLPSVYLTALYSLFNLANIREGHRVLIHSATGGLGIASIQICQSLGAHVYATVGQDVKKRFLMDRFNIPEDQIFNSRSAEFEAKIMRHTKGYGVDIILNSLTGDLLDASWRCIAEGGTMVELGKRDHLDRNALSMEPFSRNASYRCFDMSHRHVSDQVIAMLMKQMMELINKDQIKPISPMKLFPYSDIPAAFRYMRSAQHIGKIIISNKEHDNTDPMVLMRPAPRQFRLRSDRSYLIVGGLKGLCGSLAADMARHGAGNVVVLGRSGFDDARSQAVLKDVRAEGCTADLIRGDVCNEADVRRAFSTARLPVAGVVQGAMVLRDKPFETMTHAEYHTTISNKVAGTWNLHKVSLEQSHALDFFTMLSSISGLIGQPGQANYAAANVFLDNFASFRQELGLKANSVDLGAIEDVGYMAEHSHLIAALDTSAWTPINEPLFHKIVHYSIMQQDHNPIDASSSHQLITSIAVPQAAGSRLLSDARFSSLLFGNTATASQSASGDDKQVAALVVMIESGAEVAACLPLAIEVVNRQFQTLLRLDEPLEPVKNLTAYGLDSLAAVEFRNWARANLGVELTTLDVTGASSLASLVDKIMSKATAATK